MKKLTLFVASLFIALKINSLSDLEGELFKAVKDNDQTKIEWLISKNVNLNAIDEDGRTPLMDAALFLNASIVNLLIKFGALKDAKDKWGRTALHNVKMGFAFIMSGEPEERTLYYKIKLYFYRLWFTRQYLKTISALH